MKRELDVARLIAYLDERADHYTREFETSKSEGRYISAAGHGGAALALREVSLAIDKASRP